MEQTKLCATGKAINKTSQRAVTQLSRLLLIGRNKIYESVRAQNAGNYFIDRYENLPEIEQTVICLFSQNQLRLK